MWPSWVFGSLGVAKLPPQMPIRAQKGPIRAQKVSSLLLNLLVSKMIGFEARGHVAKSRRLQSHCVPIRSAPVDLRCQRRGSNRA